MSLRTLASGFAMLAMLAACNSAAPAGSSSPAVASTPAATVSPAAVTTPVPVTTPEATTADTTPVPSFADDPELAARFPTEVAGQPVPKPITARLIDFLRALRNSEAEIDTLRQKLAAIGIDLETVFLGSANAMINGTLVGILASRFPGHDANLLVQNYGVITPLNEGDTLSQETVGGKNVTVVRSSGGLASTWLYANGDVVWSTNTNKQEEAAAIFAALP